jgi:hypothetical protein
MRRLRQIGGDRRLEGSLTLMRLFVVLSAAILVGAAFVLGSALTKTLGSQALGEEQTSLTQYVDGVLGPVVVHKNRVVTTRWLSKTIAQVLDKQPDVVSVKVWRADGTLAYATLQPQRIGRRFPLDSDLGEAISENRAVASVIAPSSEGETAGEAELGFSHLIQVYAPLENAQRTRAIGAYEIYANPAALQRIIGSRVRLIWGAVIIVFVVLWLLLALLVRGASRTLRLRTCSCETGPPGCTSRTGCSSRARSRRSRVSTRRSRHGTRTPRVTRNASKSLQCRSAAHSGSHAHDSRSYGWPASSTTSASCECPTPC